MKSIIVVLLTLFLSVSFSADWPQGAGPNGNHVIKDTAPLAWSVSLNKGVTWRVPIQETGQSTPVVVGNKTFLTCFKPVKESTKEGKDLLALCYDATTGKLLWERELPGDAITRISGCFGDNSGPAPVSDGKTVCFFNASGLIKNYDFEGKEQWSVNIKNSRRSNPYLLDGVLILCGSAELTEIKERHIKGIDFRSGKLLWKSSCYSWDGLTATAYKRPNGEWVALVARGGGHVKEKFTEGFDLISLKDGQKKWSYPFKSFRSTQNFTLNDDKAYVFIPGGKHLTVNLEDGKLIKETNILDGAEAALFKGGSYTWGAMAPVNLKKRSIIQMSNLLVENYHFFRTYNDNYLGRLNLTSGKTQYLQLPTQISRSSDGVKYCWSPADIKDQTKGKKKKGKPLANLWLLKKNSMISNSGFTVVGDGRSHFSGWGHHSAAVPTVAGDYLYVPTMSGLVYVVKWNAEKLDEKSLISISDLGQLGDSWTRSSISFANGKVYARTIKELICIGGVDPESLK
jgi:outer membrane protein assembly factor BamB